MAQVFDKAGALERVGDDVVLLKDLIKLCREQCDSRLMVLMHDVRHKDLVAVKRHAHLLKGSLGNVGAAAAQEAAESLEKSAIGERFEEIDSRADALLEAINQFFEVVERDL
jgi:HPt (histidine-containing phosphotransfer) domain-containing protein